MQSLAEGSSWGADGDRDQAFARLTALVAQSGLPFIIHAHGVARTVEDMAQTPFLVKERIVKTVVFRTRGERIVLAVLRGGRRVDYPRLAALLGVNRRDLASLAPDEVRTSVGMEAGCVSPLPLRDDLLLFVDDDVLTIQPTLFCGIGRPDRTLEIAPADLVKLAHGEVGSFSRHERP